VSLTTAEVDAAEFRQALARFASGVTILTTRGADAQDYGMTASSFTSLSLSPPLILVCIDRSATMHGAVAVDRPLNVHILRAEQASLSNQFAREKGDRFQGVAATRDARGVLQLDDALAQLSCRITALHSGGDHTIVVAAVERTTVTDGDPLLYYRGAYASLDVRR
jgi:3-hydroxy-9,10-secoandrosta-1,3,5(10)-triene-9,17-dione monooxygenase reductase component